MARCEDAPCCGHEPGCCPDFDPDTGKQLNMKCTCGATVPLSSNSSLCAACLRDPEEEPLDYDEDDEDDGYGDDIMSGEDNYLSYE